MSAEPMENWNFDKAVAFVNGIENPVERGLTRLFLDRLIFFVSKKTAFPESDFDLHFFVKAVSEVTGDLPLLRSAMDCAESECEQTATVVIA